MDVDLLMSEIFARSELWDQNDRNHHNRIILDKLWDEVAAELNTTRQTARNKWKALRGKFRTTLSNLPKPKSGASGSISTKVSWKYFESLQFLRDYFTPRESTGNLPKDDESAQYNVESEEELNDTEIEDVENSQLSSPPNVETPQYSQVQSYSNDVSTPAPSRPPLSATNQSQRRKRQSNDNIGTALLELESKKVQYLEEKKKKMSVDDDLNFFKSLLPYIKNFSSSKKMTYRMKVLEVTRCFLNSADTPGNCSSQQRPTFVCGNLSVGTVPTSNHSTAGFQTTSESSRTILQQSSNQPETYYITYADPEQEKTQ